MSEYIDCNSTESAEDLLRMLVRDENCDPYITCDNKDESIESIAKRLVSQVADGTLALNVCQCGTGG